MSTVTKRLPSVKAEVTEVPDDEVPYRSQRYVNRVSLPFFRVQERKVLLVLVDTMIAVSAMLAAYDLWKIEARPVGNNMTTIPWLWIVLAAASWVTISWLAGSYDLDIADRLDQVAKRTVAIGAAAMFEGLLFYWIFLKSYPRPALAIALTSAFLGTLVWRCIYAKALGRTGATRMLLLGDRASYESLYAVTDTARSRNHVVAHVVPDEIAEAEFEDALEDLLGLIENRRIHRIVVGPKLPLTDPIVASLISAIERGVEVYDFNTAYEEIAGKVAVEHVGRHWLAAMPTRPQTSAFEEGAMRLLDVIGSIVGLAITTVLFIPIGVAIFVSSPGPMLYSQKRVGRGGTLFTIYKFRSMAVNAESSGAAWATRTDPRVTRVGRFLRGTHLDELPQFWNVLRGEMSLVGPRPERPEFTDILSNRIPFYRLRLSVKPGITGLKQIKFGYAGSEEEHLEVLRHDLYYIKHRSLMLNLSIITQTIGSMISVEGR